MAPKNSPSSHEITFGLLFLLVFCSVGARLIDFPPLTNNLIIFASAFSMAVLVITQYMGLKIEGMVVRLTVAVPLILFAVLVGILLMDIAHVPLPHL